MGSGWAAHVRACSELLAPSPPCAGRGQVYAHLRATLGRGKKGQWPGRRGRGFLGDGWVWNLETHLRFCPSACNLNKTLDARLEVGKRAGPAAETDHDAHEELCPTWSSKHPGKGSGAHTHPHCPHHAPAGQIGRPGSHTGPAPAVPATARPPSPPAPGAQPLPASAPPAGQPHA